MAGINNFDVDLVAAAQESVAFGALADRVATTLNEGGDVIENNCAELKGAAVNAFTELMAVWTDSSKLINKAMDKLGQAIGVAMKSLGVGEQAGSDLFVTGTQVDPGAVHTGGSVTVRGRTAMTTTATTITFKSATVGEIEAELRRLLRKLRGQLDEAEAIAARLSSVWTSQAEQAYRSSHQTWSREYNDLSDAVNTMADRTDDWARTSAGADRHCVTVFGG